MQTDPRCQALEGCCPIACPVMMTLFYPTQHADTCTAARATAELPFRLYFVWINSNSHVWPVVLNWTASSRWYLHMALPVILPASVQLYG